VCATPALDRQSTRDVDGDAVAAGVTRLRELIPALTERVPGVQATVFAGYKQDVDGQVTQRLVESLPGGPPVVVAVPSIYAGAWANARGVVELIAALAPPPSTERPLAFAPDPVQVGQENEARPDARWIPWRDWADSYA
jgi:hypothetical protein